ncbi:NUDIX domain-containing protein [Alkalilimnicola ehrlichii]|nr:NUDIX domain-containing protein [Alkalilimnicola ehrlichii]
MTSSTYRPASAAEARFLAEYDASAYATPLVTVDPVIVTLRDEQLAVLLVKREEHPFLGSWGLPGGFIDIRNDADPEACAVRKLKEKAAFVSPYLEQVKTVGGRERDPRGWSLTVLFFALIAEDDVPPIDKRLAKWFPLSALPDAMAFDHRALIDCAIRRIRAKAEYTALPAHLLPQRFTLSKMQRVFELVLQRRLTAGAFRRRIEPLVEPIADCFETASHRPAQVYRLRPDSGSLIFEQPLKGARRK